jgi:hypothetical protein
MSKKTKGYSYIVVAIATWNMATLLFVFGAPNASAQNPEGIILCGIIKFQMYAGEHSVVRGMSSTNVFQLSLNQRGCWLMEIHPLYAKNSSMSGKVDTIYLSFDGTDTYFCHYTEAVTGLTNGQPSIVMTEPIDSRMQEAYVSEGNFPFCPFDNQARGNILWLAFCAGEYLYDTKTNTIPLPWIPARQNLLAFGFRVDADLSANLPHAPTHLEFLRDKRLDKADLAGELDRLELNKPFDDKWVESLKRDVLDRDNMYKDAAVAGELTPANFTNAYGFEVPLTFDFRVFIPTMIKSDHVRRLYSGMVTNIAVLSESVSFRPPISANMHVHDSRFRHRDNAHQLDEIIYPMATDGHWMATNDAILTTNYNDQLQWVSSKRFNYGHATLVRFIGTIVMALTAASLPIFFLWRFIRRKSRSS